jgi:hypothetical protein
VTGIEAEWNGWRERLERTAAENGWAVSGDLGS